jgi:VCBS repeat protein
VTGNDLDVSVLLGNGDGSFQCAQSIVLLGEVPGFYSGVAQSALSVAVGDLNADNTLDLVVTGLTSFTGTYCDDYGCDDTTYYGSHVNVLLGHGDGATAATRCSPRVAASARF